MAKAASVKFATSKTLPGTSLPPVKTCEITASAAVLAAVTFFGCLTRAQEFAIRNAYATNKANHKLAIQIDGPTIRFRPLGSMPAPTETELRNLLDRMGILKTDSPPPKAAPIKQPAIMSTSKQRRAVIANWLTRQYA